MAEYAHKSKHGIVVPIESNEQISICFVFLSICIFKVNTIKTARRRQLNEGVMWNVDEILFKQEIATPQGKFIVLTILCTCITVNMGTKNK